MGWHAGRKLRKAVDALGRVLAIEIMTAARGLELRAPLQPSPVTAAVIAELRANGTHGPGTDRYLSPEIEAAAALTLSGRVRETAARASTTPLI